MNPDGFFLYLLVMAGTTYLVRAIPFVLIRKKIKNRFLNSFLYYIPYTVLAAMTFPAIFYVSSSLPASILGTITALALSFFGQSLLVVAASSALVIYLAQLVL
ncbi:MAG: AzlD domain-containing protein [Firmicutes bacterium]|nr:AzlD domain-containing protein [Bacillota bacterium]